MSIFDDLKIIPALVLVIEVFLDQLHLIPGVEGFGLLGPESEKEISGLVRTGITDNHAFVPESLEV